MDYFEAKLEAAYRQAEILCDETQELSEEIMDDPKLFWSLLGNFMQDDEQFVTTLRSMINAYHHGRDGSTYAKSLTIRAFDLAEYAIKKGAVL